MMAVNEAVRTEFETTEAEPILSVTPTATQIIHTLLEQRQIPNHVLRVYVSSGGCSGLSYGMRFEEAPQNFDAVVETDGVRLVVDPTSLMYIKGSTIDYLDSLMGGGFRVDNPNQVSTCGCGHSFRTADSSAGSGSSGCGSCSY